MAETTKKTTKTAAKPRKTAAKKATAKTSADPAVENHHGSPENHHAAGAERTASHEDVARLAHSYWKERGGKHGFHEEDWYRAEQELRGKAS